VREAGMKSGLLRWRGCCVSKVNRY
jgi:hypothetical protein